MTRPMPGPPEPVPHEFDTLPHKLTDDPWVYCSGCAAENRIRLADPKRLKDAECAAEFWRAEGDHCLASEGYDIDWFSGGLLRDEDIACDVHATWHRFATHPHALDAT